MELLFPLLILALLVPMFLGMRRQKREIAKTADLQDSLKVGDRIMTTAGLHGTVAGLGESTIELEIAPGVVTEWSRLVVRELVTEDDDDVADTDDVAEDQVDETPEQSQRRLDQGRDQE